MYYLLENIIHYYYCQSEGGEDSSQGGEDSPPSPPLENTLSTYTYITHRVEVALDKPGRAVVRSLHVLGVLQRETQHTSHIYTCTVESPLKETPNKVQ